jgi:hypothetical protein
LGSAHLAGSQRGIRPEPPRPPLAAAPNLAAFAPEGRERRAALLTLLHCEISFGRCRGGSGPWEILLSTLPHREGRSLLDMDGRRA